MKRHLNHNTDKKCRYVDPDANISTGKEDRLLKKSGKVEQCLDV